MVGAFFTFLSLLARISLTYSQFFHSFFQMWSKWNTGTPPLWMVFLKVGIRWGAFYSPAIHTVYWIPPRLRICYFSRSHNTRIWLLIRYFAIRTPPPTPNIFCLSFSPPFAIYSLPNDVGRFLCVPHSHHRLEGRELSREYALACARTVQRKFMTVFTTGVLCSQGPAGLGIGPGVIGGEPDAPNGNFNYRNGTTFEVRTYSLLRTCEKNLILSITSVYLYCTNVFLLLFCRRNSTATTTTIVKSPATTAAISSRSATVLRISLLSGPTLGTDSRRTETRLTPAIGARRSVEALRVLWRHPATCLHTAAGKTAVDRCSMDPAIRICRLGEIF